MKTIFVGVFGVSILAGATRICEASSDKCELSEGWEVKVLRLPAHFNWTHSLTDETAGAGGSKDNKSVANDSPTVVIDLPGEEASKETWVKHIKDSTAIISRWCRESELEFPAGTVLLHDTETGTLAVRTSSSAMRDLEFLAYQQVVKLPKTLTFSVDVIQSDAATVQGWVAETTTQQDHSESWKKALKPVDAGGAQRIGRVHLSTTTRRKASARIGDDVPHDTMFTLVGGVKVEMLHEERHAGTSLTIDPTMRPDNRLIDLDVEFEHHFAPPSRRTVLASSAGAPGRFEIPLKDYHMARITASTVMSGNSTRLLGVWKSHEKPEFKNEQVLQAAFLHAEVAPLLPAEKKNLISLLHKHADEAAPIPKSDAVTMAKSDGLSSSLQTRTVRVLPDFFIQPVKSALQTSIAPVDPFLTPSQKTKLVTPMAALRSLNLPFPEGSSALYDMETATLRVRAPLETLREVETYTESFAIRQPALLTVTTQIYECDGPTMRKLLEDTQGTSDRTETLQQLNALAVQGQARLLNIIRQETRSGLSSLSEAGVSHMYVADVQVPAPFPPSLDDQAEEEPLPTVKENNKLITATLKSRMCGMRLAADPVLAPAGTTIHADIDLRFDFAPPQEAMQRDDAGGSAGVTMMRPEFPASEYHTAEVKTSLTLSSGIPQLIGSWKPEGTPEYAAKDVLQAAFVRVDVHHIE